MKKILCVGHSAYDISYLLSEFPIENRKYKAKERRMMSGGPAGNAAYLLGKYGEEVSYITVLGKDLYAKAILQDLESVGVDTSGVILRDDVETPCSIILIHEKNGSRTIVNHRGKSIQETLDFSDKKSPKFMLFDGHNVSLALQALQAFPEAVSVLDAGSYHEGTKTLASLVDYCICSEDFAREASGRTSLAEEEYETVFEDLEEKTKGDLVITLGEKGYLFRDASTLKKREAYTVNVVDTTGAGDVFHGAFVYALSQGFSFEESLDFSALTAALSVEKIGGQASIPSLDEIERRRIQLKK